MDVDRDASVEAGVRSVAEAEGQLRAVVACAGWGLAGRRTRPSIRPRPNSRRTSGARCGWSRLPYR